MSQRRRKKMRRSTQRRSLRAERLEQRRLLAADTGLTLHNAELPTDVNGDGRVSSIDALAVVNHITRTVNARPEGLLASSSIGPVGPSTDQSSPAAVSIPPKMVDVAV